MTYLFEDLSIFMSLFATCHLEGSFIPNTRKPYASPVLSYEAAVCLRFLVPLGPGDLIVGLLAIDALGLESLYEQSFPLYLSLLPSFVGPILQRW